jgi:hypothetical protein
LSNGSALCHDEACLVGWQKLRPDPDAERDERHHCANAATLKHRRARRALDLAGVDVTTAADLRVRQRMAEQARCKQSWLRRGLDR